MNDDDDTGNTNDDLNLKPLLDDNASINVNTGTGINNTFSTIGTIFNNTTTNTNTNNNNRLRIKSNQGDTNIELPNQGCLSTTTVSQLKTLVRFALLEKERKESSSNNTHRNADSSNSSSSNNNNNNNNNTNNEDRNLRLICKGRLLSPDESFLSEFKVIDDDVIHAVSSSQIHNNSEKRQYDSAGNSNNNNNNNNNDNNHQLQQQQQRRRYNNRRHNRGIGTVVGPGGRVTRVSAGNDSNRDNESDSEDEYHDLERGEGTSPRRRERRGFDRLRLTGLSRHEITAIRSYFNRHVERYIEQHQQLLQQNSNNESVAAGEENTSRVTAVEGNESGGTNNASAASRRLHLDEVNLSRRRLLIEEDWMTTQGPESEFRLNLNQNTLQRASTLGGGGLLRNTHRQQQYGRIGNDRDFIWGFCLGFFVGMIGLLWVWVPTVPHKQKIGILCGICVQFFLNKDSMDGEVFVNNYDDGD